MKNRSTVSILTASLATAIGLMLSGIDNASAEQAIHEVGTLTCSLAPEAQATPSEPGQGRAALCHFRPGDKGAEETYVGTFQFIGQEKLSAGSRTIMLVVKAPVSKKITVALLEQSYSADASTGAGKQSPLVGSKDSSVVLQSETTHSEQPTMALGQPMPALIIIADLKLRSSPA
jgi:Protein of unknown function (DUF992)